MVIVGPCGCSPARSVCTQSRGAPEAQRWWIDLGFSFEHKTLKFHGRATLGPEAPYPKPHLARPVRTVLVEPRVGVVGLDLE
jgi:hypothetical protein